MDISKCSKFDFIIATNSIPFSNKGKLYELFNKLIKKSKKNCIYSINFFTKNSTYIKKKTCFSMNKMK